MQNFIQNCVDLTWNAPIAQCRIHSLTWLSVKKISFPCTDSSASNIFSTLMKQLGGTQSEIEELDEVSLINK